MTTIIHTHHPIDPHTITVDSPRSIPLSLPPFASKAQSSLLPCLLTPAILSAFLEHIPWKSFLALSQASKQIRQFYEKSQKAKDIVLSRYIPVYRQVLSLRNPIRVQDVHVSLHDIDLFLKSQNTDLCVYPTHTLSLSSALLPDDTLQRQTRMLSALTQAHSRLVLLIQSIVHSSPLPLDSETFSNQRTTRLSKPSLRELTFPAPLSYGHTSGSVTAHVCDDQSPALQRSPTPDVTTPSTVNKRRSTLSRSNTRGRRNAAMPNRRASIFDFGAPAPPLPPPAEPKSLTTLSRGWRRSKHASLDDATSSLSRRSFRGQQVFGSVEEGLSTLAKHSSCPPTRHHSSDSEFSESPISTPPSSDPTSPTDAPSFTQLKDITMTSPHDLSMATLRTRAPVLRVFVPCSELPDAENDTIVQCEDQLCDSGLWNYLSVGDIICNLGCAPFTEYNPPAGARSSPTASDGSSQTSGSSWNDIPLRAWFLFNGHNLVPFCPPHPLPVPDALSLPTPFYYSHLIPEIENPSFILKQLPPIKNVQDVLKKLRLCHLPSKVPSPNSPMGYALVRRHVWTAQVRIEQQPLSSQDVSPREIGDGWCGTWILECQGTKEGRLLLEKALNSEDVGTSCYWELVKDRSQNGRLWFRLIQWTHNI